MFTWNNSAPKNPSLFTKSFANITKGFQTVALLNFVFEFGKPIHPKRGRKIELKDNFICLEPG